MSTNSRLIRWLPLLAAVVLSPFANGCDSVPLAAWLAPIFLMRFVRTQRARVGLPIAYVLVALAFAVQFRGMVPLRGASYYVFLATMALALLMPYALDRLVGPRLDDGAARLLLFPAAATALEFAASFGPFGTWGATAYSQYGSMPLVQLASVTGLWGIDFLVFAAAPVSNRVWERGWRAMSAWRAAAGFALVLAIVLLGGGARLALSTPTTRTVRIAALTHPPIELDDEVSARVSDGAANASDRSAFAAWARSVGDDLLTRADREAAAGAKLVFWDEAGAPVLPADEPALLARGAELAARRRIYLGMSLGTWTIGAPKPLQNKLVLIDPTGRVVFTYHKSRPVMGSEAQVLASGEGKLPRVDTPFGRLSAIICFDGDHARLLAQAGAMQADIVLDPSSDWRQIDPWHTRMASFRAVEQGVTLIRQTHKGLSAVFDAHGVALASMDHYQSEDRVLVAQVPTAGVRTIYARLGDWFGWLSVTAVLILFAMAYRARAGDARPVQAVIDGAPSSAAAFSRERAILAP
jgi:apolipoprotein N-acyltransferase